MRSSAFLRAKRFFRKKSTRKAQKSVFWGTKIKPKAFQVRLKSYSEFKIATGAPKLASWDPLGGVGKGEWWPACGRVVAGVWPGGGRRVAEWWPGRIEPRPKSPLFTLFDTLSSHTPMTPRGRWILYFSKYIYILYTNHYI